MYIWKRNGCCLDLNLKYEQKFAVKEHPLYLSDGVICHYLKFAENFDKFSSALL